jgi:hypothetical protein
MNTQQRGYMYYPPSKLLNALHLQGGKNPATLIGLFDLEDGSTRDPATCFYHV